MNLYRVSLKYAYKWNNTKKNLYVIASSKEKVVEMIQLGMRENFGIDKVYYLGYELSSVLFQGGKREKKL